MGFPMAMQDSVTTCISKYIDVQGRASRPEDWWWVLFIIVASVVLMLVDRLLFGSSATDYGVLRGLFGLATVLPSITVAARRLHDVDKSGWWLLLALIPLIGGLVVLYFLVQPGTQGPNRFGNPVGLIRA